MSRVWLALVVLFLGIARGAAPSYSAASIVNSASYAAGPFAPNSLLTIYGTNLATATAALTGTDIVSNALPTELGGIGTSVYIDNSPVPLLYVSPTQINFVLPGTVCSVAPPCSVAVRVVSDSNAGPDVTLDLVAAVPALFSTADGYAIATHGDSSSVVTPDAPAHAGDIVVLYATGLGKTVPDPEAGYLQCCPALLANLSSLTVTIGGATITYPSGISYAGLTPLSVALYQINLILPNGVGTNPAITVSIAGQSSPAGVKLAVE